MKKQIKIKFYGIDDLNRPVFKSITDKMFFGSTESLFSFGEDRKRIIDFFRHKIKQLVYFGQYFNCEPLGIAVEDLLTPLELEIVEG